MQAWMILPYFVLWATLANHGIHTVFGYPGGAIMPVYDALTFYPEMRHILARPFDVRPGNVAMYCPEANVLVPKGVDPISKTPSFKLVPVMVEAEETAARREPPVVALAT